MRRKNDNRPEKIIISVHCAHRPNNADIYRETMVYNNISMDWMNERMPYTAHIDERDENEIVNEVWRRVLPLVTSIGNPLLYCWQFLYFVLIVDAFAVAIVHWSTIVLYLNIEGNSHRRYTIQHWILRGRKKGHCFPFFVYEVLFSLYVFIEWVRICRVIIRNGFAYNACGRLSYMFLHCASGSEW